MLTAEKISRGLGGAPRTGGGYKARCPAHDDARPSLDIDDRNGKTLFVCRTGGCTQDQIIAALVDRDLWPNGNGNGNGHKNRPERRREDRAAKKAAEAKPKREIKSRTQVGQPRDYEIRGTDGELVAVHERIDYEIIYADGGVGYDDGGIGHGKELYWRLPNWRPGDRKNLGGRPTTSLPFYGSEKLPALPDGIRILVVEGEKAAEAAWRAGLNCVGTVNGAPGIPDAAVLDCLLRFAVEIWPDNDDPGRAQANGIAARLLALGCRDVRIVEWKEAPEGGDIADFEGDEDALLALIEGAKPFEPAAAIPAFGQLASEVADRQIEYVVPRYIPRGKQCEFNGDPGDGKTYVAIDLAAAITRGRSFAGQVCVQGRVAFLSAEEEPEDLKQRLKEAGADLELVRILPDSFDTENGIEPLTLPDHIPMIEEILRADGTLVLFIDPLTAFLNGKTDSNNDASSRRVLAHLKRLAQRTRTTVCIIRHLNKMGTVDKAIYRGGGSIAFTAASRISFLIAPDPTDRALEIERRRVFACVKTNLPGPKPPSMAFVLSSPAIEIPAHVEWLQEPSQLTADDLLREHHQPRKKEALEQAKEFLRDELDAGPKNSKDIIEHALALGISEATLNRARKNLNIIARKKGYAAGWVWSLSNTTNDQASPDDNSTKEW